MNALLSVGTTGIPLIIIEKSAYAHWLLKQSKQDQRWLKQSDFQGEGLALLPNFSTTEEGSLRQVLFVVSDANHYFSCGNLITQLPPEQYQLNAAPEHQQAICFGWLIGAYEYAGYKTNKKEKAT